MSIVRQNLMNEPHYSPYCGSTNCRLHSPRTQFNGNQFQCGCGWESQFDPQFIKDYKEKWNK